MAETAYHQCTRPVAGAQATARGPWRGFADATAQRWSDGPRLLRSGTLLAEMRPGHGAGAPALVAEAPGLRLGLASDGLTVTAQGAEAQVPITSDSGVGALNIGMTWQSEGGRLTVALWHGQGAVSMAELPWRGPLDVEALWDRCPKGGGEGIAGIALSDQIEPLGSVGGIDPQALVETSHGRRLASQLVAGDMVLTADGDLAQVRWAGTLTAPAFPSRAPVRVRAPYLGLWRDLVLSPQEALRIEGTDVEYLFGTPAVLVPVNAIRRDPIVVAEPTGPYVALSSIVLDRPVALIANGAAVQRLAGAGNTATAQMGYDARAVGLCGRIPVSLWPCAQGTEQLPVLRREEMRMLLNFRAA